MDTSVEVKDEPTSVERPDSTNASTSSYTSVTHNGFFTSTPYFGFGRTQLPAITSIYSPFAKYYGVQESSARFSQDTSSPASFDLSTGTDQYSPPPKLVPFTANLGYSFDSPSYTLKPFNSTLQSDSGISSGASSLSTPLGRNTVRGYKKTYCSICKMHINKDGKRSQGPRRHLLQYHVRRPLFQCPHCSHASFYDKFHVTSHMRRIHQDNSERLINRSSEFEDEVEEWYERCFGERRNSNGSEMRQSSQRSLNPNGSRFSPPPVLTPEVPDQENVDPCRVGVVDLPELLADSPFHPPSKKRKMGFMIDDILELDPVEKSTS
uniref:C2H2-type domain-containing protein n=1 Tax=Haemonchus contortus TaxID=6289 RepID=A0A7I4YT41_HAECO